MSSAALHQKCGLQATTGPSRAAVFAPCCRRPFGRPCKRRRTRVQTAAIAEEELDVAIIGGGPGGLAAAKALLVASPGLRVGVFERSTLRPRGASLSVMPNGIRALEAIQLGLGTAVLGIHVEVRERRNYSSAGELLSMAAEEGSSAAFIRSPGGPYSLCAWHELQAALARQLPPGVLRTEAAFAGYVEDHIGGSLRVTFQDNSHPPVAARVLVGADGAQSAVRQRAIGDGPPAYQGSAIWRAVRARPSWWPPASQSAHPGGSGSSQCSSSSVSSSSFTGSRESSAGSGRVSGSYLIWAAVPRMVRAFPHTADSIIWQAFAPWPDDRLHEIGGGGAVYTPDPEQRREWGEDRKRRALEAFDGWCPEVQDLIAGTDPLALTEHGQFSREPSDCQVWGAGRATLLGDAAHLAPQMLAQGSSQAFEDALELGRAVGRLGPTPEALRAYESARQPQAAFVHEAALAMHRDFQAGRYRAGGSPPLELRRSAELGLWTRELQPLVPALRRREAAGLDGGM